MDVNRLEAIVRTAHKYSQSSFASEESEHPFDARNIHPRLPDDVRELFDNGHFAQATFEAFKFLDKFVQKHSSSTETGKSLMMKVFSETSPAISLNSLSTETERNEQEGYKFLFAGGIIAIRNPRGHEYSVRDSVDDALDHLSFVSMLLRRLNAVGFK